MVYKILCFTSLPFLDQSDTKLYLVYYQSQPFLEALTQPYPCYPNLVLAHWQPLPNVNVPSSMPEWVFLIYHQVTLLEIWLCFVKQQVISYLLFIYSCLQYRRRHVEIFLFRLNLTDKCQILYFSLNTCLLTLKISRFI